MANETSRTARRQKKSKKPILKRIILGIILAMLVIGVGVAALFTFYIIKAPDLDPDKLSDPFSSEIYDMDGEFVTDRGGSEKRKKIKYEDLPDELIQAVIATEDSRFFEHPGIDIPRIFGAIKANIFNGFGSEGASTITQQVVENSFLTPDKTIELKVQEQWLALKLEREYSKEEILEMYLNKIFYGSNAHGVAKASEIYFGKTDLHDLTLTESAMLAGLPQRPSAYNPYENPDLMAGRVDTVLKLMVRHDKITQAEADEARGVDIASTLSGKRPTAREHDGFVQQVEKEVKEKLDGADINTDGLKIYTTLDTKAQKHVEFLLTNGADNPVNYPDGELEAGLSVVDNETGAVRAIGGSRNNENVDSFNYAIDLQRQGGSTMKPLAAYGPAIEYEKWSTYQQIKDDTFFPKGSSSEIRNYDRQHHGTLSMRDALAKSYNVPAAKAFEEIGSERVREFGTDLGINYADKTLNARDAIGGTATNITPFELAGAYSAFANKGVYTEAHTITKVEYPDGTTVDLTPDSDPVMEDYTAYMITDMLKTAITEGTGTNANIPGLDVAGKTGTTSGNKDSWFAGYTSKYTVAVWTGYNEENKRIEDTQVPHALFKNTMAEISKDIDTPDFTKPDSVVEVNVANGSNPPALASSGQSSVKELFVKGTEPGKGSVEKAETYPSVQDLTANYDEDKDQIDISWSHEDSDASFEVSSAINGNSMKVEETTSSTASTISNVENDAKYTIQLIAISDDNVKSDPKTVTVQVGDDEEDIPAVTNLSANLVDNNINVTWEYDGPDATFEVNANGSNDSVSDQIYTVDNPDTDAEYTITVTAVSDGDKGPPATVNIRVEDPEEEEDKKKQEEEDEQEKQDELDEQKKQEEEDKQDSLEEEKKKEEEQKQEEEDKQQEQEETPENP